MAVDDAFLKQRIDALFETNFDVRDGRVIPATTDVTLKDGAVKIEAAFLYADLAGSALLSKTCPWSTTAKIIRAFLDCSTRLILKNGGVVRSFDGDRVMGIFIGDSKNSSAANCGREIHWVVRNTLHPAAHKKFDSIKNNNIEIRNCSGVDVGDVHAVRSGVRDSNDLIWIGKAASFSAKLSDIRDQPYHTYISSRTHAKLNQEAKFDSSGVSLWTKSDFSFAGENETVYKSNHWKKP